MSLNKISLLSTIQMKRFAKLFLKLKKKISSSKLDPKTTSFENFSQNLQEIVSKTLFQIISNPQANDFAYSFSEGLSDLSHLLTVRVPSYFTMLQDDNGSSQFNQYRYDIVSRLNATSSNDFEKKDIEEAIDFVCFMDEAVQLVRKTFLFVPNVVFSLETLVMKRHRRICS